MIGKKKKVLLLRKKKKKVGKTLWPSSKEGGDYQLVRLQKERKKDNMAELSQAIPPLDLRSSRPEKKGAPRTIYLNRETKKREGTHDLKERSVAGRSRRVRFSPLLTTHEEKGKKKKEKKKKKKKKKTEYRKKKGGPILKRGSSIRTLLRKTCKTQSASREKTVDRKGSRLSRNKKAVSTARKKGSLEDEEGLFFDPRRRDRRTYHRRKPSFTRKQKGGERFISKEPQKSRSIFLNREVYFCDGKEKGAYKGDASSEKKREIASKKPFGGCFSAEKKRPVLRKKKATLE